MTGKLTLEAEKQTGRTVLSVVLTAALTAGITLTLGRRLVGRTEGLLQGALLALMAYVLFRLLYPMFTGLFPSGEKQRTVDWTLTGDTLTLGEDAIALSTIRQVHAWPNRDALGNRGKGFVVNIETTGKNRVLRSLTEGEEADRSAEALRALVEALGYGDRWTED